MTYTPKINDYVKWHHNGHIDEGWVYFVCDQSISIEVGTKPKCEQNVKDSPLHKKTHILVVCQRWYWHELEYVKSRNSIHDENLTKTYKSQEYRPIDP